MSAKNENLNRYMKEYKAWYQMMQRCTNPNHPRYKDYGGRGIKVCERWMKFENFFEDMGKAASPSHSLDRFPNNDGDYELSNCRWATWEQQHSNKRGVRLITLNGETNSIAGWARKLKIHKSAILYRLGRGWSEYRAITEPAHEEMRRL